MNDPAAPPAPAPAADVGRPVEMELWSNRRLIHPLSRALAKRLVPTGVSPDMVSIAGAVMAAAGAGAYTLLPRPWGAMLGLACHVLWHVLDGADGDLARRTGRSSPRGELIDGICDYAGRTVLYLALGAYAAAQVGPWAWVLTVFVGLSRIVQANFYETVRREYRKWVYGTGWLRQTLERGGLRGDTVGGAPAALGRLFLAVSTRATPDTAAVDAAFERRAVLGPDGLKGARTVCRTELMPVVKRAAVLSANSETLVIFLSMLAGSPLYLFGYVAVLLNGAYAALYADQRRRLAETAQALETQARAPG